MQPINICYCFRPAQRSLATGQVADLFGLAAEEPPHVVADNVVLDIKPGDVVLFSGPSGSGKSSLLRAASAQLGAIDAMNIELPDVPLIDALPGNVVERMNVLAAFGLSEARLLLRRPSELSDGQRYRFRLAWAFAPHSSLRGEGPGKWGCGRVASTPPPNPLPETERGRRTICADEFGANLERTLAKVLAFNVRKQVTRTGVGMLLATTHEDIIADLSPDLHVRCRGNGTVLQIRDDRARTRRAISFASELRMVEGRASDWPAFACWHYRNQRIAFVKRVVLLKHGGDAIGICVFAAPAATLSLRSRYFGLAGPRSRVTLRALNEQLWLLARVVLHPTYRGAGIGAEFVRSACASCPVPWIETLSAMGHASPFFEHAGFKRVGIIEASRERKRPEQAGQYAADGARYCSATVQKSRHSAPMYYVFDNR